MYEIPRVVKFTLSFTESKMVDARGWGKWEMGNDGKREMMNCFMSRVSVLCDENTLDTGCTT